LSLSSTYIFQPIAVEDVGVFSELGRQNADVREGSVLFQCISVVVQHFNAVLLHDTMVTNLPDPYPSNNLF